MEKNGQGPEQTKDARKPNSMKGGDKTSRGIKPISA